MDEIKKRQGYSPFNLYDGATLLHTSEKSYICSWLYVGSEIFSDQF